MPAPPPGPPWDLPLEQAPLVFVDLEMTGLDPTVDRVVEICAERVVGGARVALVHTLVNPGERTGNAHVHGIEAADVADAPSFEALAGGVRAVLDGAVLVAHSASWDVRFLKAEAARAAVPFCVDFWLDTLILARRAFAYRSYSLDALCRELGIDRGRAHRADSDVRAMRAVFDRCVDVLKPTTVRDLLDVRVGERHARATVLALCQAAAENKASLSVTYRPAGRPAQALSLVVLEVLSELDPPRIVGYQLPGRGRRELRADRILRVEPLAGVPIPQ